MVAQDYIPTAPAKQTIEKIVRQKPKIEDLITVERPGKPSSALLLENAPSKRSAKTTKPSKKSGEVKTVRDHLLIITEKPQAASKIASAIGDAKKLSDNGVSYFELTKDGKKIYVASAVGHLFNLTYKKGQSGWPVFDLEWKGSHEIKASFTKKYFDVLKKLANRSSEFIVATDFDVEGEVIGWNVLRFICNRETAKRMKFSTLTHDELLNAYNNSLNELNWGNAYAGEARHFIDWLYGINLSRAMMSSIKKAGSFKILSIGRVQGPALKIIVDRDREIDNFKSEPYFTASAIKGPYEFKHPKDIFDAKEIEKFEKVKEVTSETKKSEEKIAPGVPFDLTTLQREAYRLYKINPAQTLEIAQRLYLDGIISYPRTSSQKIPDVIEPKKILKKLVKYFPEAARATRKVPIEGKKSDPAHPSIYPTGDYKDCEGQDAQLYLLIVKRFIACFSEDCITNNKKITLTAVDKEGNKIKYNYQKRKQQDAFDDEEEKEKVEEDKSKDAVINFIGDAVCVVKKGWTEFYPIKIEEMDIADMNGKMMIDEIKIESKETQPPNRFTPASLVSILERKNLGTKATRSSIIETLFERGYLDGRSIKATPLGLHLIESLEKYSPIIVDENLTRQLEEQMEEIQSSSQDFAKKKDNVVKKAKEIIAEISKELKENEENIGKHLTEGLTSFRKEQNEQNTLMPCPQCGKGNLRIMFSKKTKRYFVSCSAYPDCKKIFSLPPNALIKKADKVCPEDNFPKLLAIRKAKRPWEFCFNPDCPEEKRKRLEWEKKRI